MDKDFKDIKLPGRLCFRIKFIYFPNGEWINHYDEVASKFSQLKKNLIIFYPNMSMPERMDEVDKLSDCDLKQMVEHVSECST